MLTSGPSSLELPPHARILLLQHLQRRDPLVGQHVQPLGLDLAADPRVEQLRALEQVLDLAAVQGQLREPVQVLRRDIELVLAEMLKEVVPDLLARVVVEVMVREEQVDARLEGVVDAREAVGRQEEDALVVLELGEEDWACQQRPVSGCLGEDLLDTSSFLFRLSSRRSPRKTSASSSSSMAFHSRQSSRACVRAGSTT
jgi:hypothetical protein